MHLGSLTNVAVGAFGLMRADMFIPRDLVRRTMTGQLDAHRAIIAGRLVPKEMLLP